jgi:hypothetical protein
MFIGHKNTMTEKFLQLKAILELNLLRTVPTPIQNYLKANIATGLLNGTKRESIRHS